MRKLSDDIEEVLLAISASGFDWAAAIARSEILASEKVQEGKGSPGSDVEYLSIIESVLRRLQ
jgi:hypothetical protein